MAILISLIVRPSRLKIAPEQIVILGEIATKVIYDTSENIADILYS